MEIVMLLKMKMNMKKKMMMIMMIMMVVVMRRMIIFNHDKIHFGYIQSVSKHVFICLSIICAHGIS